MAETVIDKKYPKEMITLLLATLLATMAYMRLLEYLRASDLTIFEFLRQLWSLMVFYIWPILKVFSVLLSLAALVGIFYNWRKLRELNLEEWQVFGSPSVAIPAEDIIAVKNEKWERIIRLINSTSSSDWRLAIIEADVMLEELLCRAGYHGESIGEMLKSVEKSDFTSIESAWEAHKTRNAIAHRGADFPLNEREAKRAITLFEEVFKEFKII